MAKMNLDNKANIICREFRAHARGHALSRFDSSYDAQMVDVPDASNLTHKNLKTMIANVIVGFGRKNRLKYIKHHMRTASKPHGTSQDAFMEHMHVMQS